MNVRGSDAIRRQSERTRLGGCDMYEGLKTGRIEKRIIKEPA